MEQSLQASVNRVSFRRPTVQVHFRRFMRRCSRKLELIGRARAANALKMYGYDELAKDVMQGYWKNA